jgi:ring-1,2-phenylacetyl-CoA epoxidase subunit PaaD
VSAADHAAPRDTGSGPTGAAGPTGPTGTSPAAPDNAAVRAAVEAVPDPELPAVTIGDLGMLHDLCVDTAGTVEVELLPTFAGCPATDLIGEDVRDAVREVPGVRAVTVRFRLDPPWGTQRITERGRERLRDFGIAPPVAGPPSSESTSLGVLPLLSVGSSPAPAPCPYCGSRETETDSPFGPTPCRAIQYCRSCRQPFEAFKAL